MSTAIYDHRHNCSIPGALHACVEPAHQRGECGGLVVVLVGNEEAAVRELFHSPQLMTQALKRGRFGISVHVVPHERRRRGSDCC